MDNERNVKQEEPNNKKKIIAIIKKGLIGAGLVVGGYILGDKVTTYKTARGLQQCCLEDPTLEDHLKETLKTLKERRESMDTVD